MAQQTAVEWLIEQCPRIETIVAYNILEQAKQMEMVQIVQAYHRGLFSSMELEKPIVFADEYYKETFKK